MHLGEFPSPHHTLEAGGHLAGEGADFAVDRITGAPGPMAEPQPTLPRVAVYHLVCDVMSAAGCRCACRLPLRLPLDCSCRL